MSHESDLDVEGDDSDSSADKDYLEKQYMIQELTDQLDQLKREKDKKPIRTKFKPKLSSQYQYRFIGCKSDASGLFTSKFDPRKYLSLRKVNYDGKVFKLLLNFEFPDENIIHLVYKNAKYVVVKTAYILDKNKCFIFDLNHSLDIKKDKNISTEDCIYYVTEADDFIKYLQKTEDNKDFEFDINDVQLQYFDDILQLLDKWVTFLNQKVTSLMWATFVKHIRTLYRNTRIYKQIFINNMCDIDSTINQIDTMLKDVERTIAECIEIILLRSYQIFDSTPRTTDELRIVLRNGLVVRGLNPASHSWIIELLQEDLQERNNFSLIHKLKKSLVDLTLSKYRVDDSILDINEIHLHEPAGNDMFLKIEGQRLRSRDIIQNLGNTIRSNKSSSYIDSTFTRNKDELVTKVERFGMENIEKMSDILRNIFSVVLVSYRKCLSDNTIDVGLNMDEFDGEGDDCDIVVSVSIPVNNIAYCLNIGCLLKNKVTYDESKQNAVHYPSQYSCKIKQKKCQVCDCSISEHIVIDHVPVRQKHKLKNGVNKLKFLKTTKYNQSLNLERELRSILELISQLNSYSKVDEMKHFFDRIKIKLVLENDASFARYFDNCFVKYYYDDLLTNQSQSGGTELSEIINKSDVYIKKYTSGLS